LALAHDRVIVYLQDAGATPIATNGNSTPSKSAAAKAPDSARAAMPAGNPATHVEDAARFFKPDTIAQAKELAAAIKSKHRKDVAVESFAGVPDSEKVKFNQLDRLGQDAFVKQWATDRAAKLKTDGVYILICRAPPKLYVHTANRSVDDATVEATRKTLLQAFVKREYDRGLLDSIRAIGAELETKGKK
jgi:hypothetical protein